VEAVIPTYEYKCSACGIEFEKEQRISEPAEAECPACGSTETKRLISLSSFVLKGTGWYVTDYARKSGNGSQASNKTSSRKDESSDTNIKTENKPSPTSKTATDGKTAAHA